jgi:site-specific DNA recombinase
MVNQPRRKRSVAEILAAKPAVPTPISRTGTLHNPSTIVEVEIPTIVSMELYERVQRRLSVNNPRVTAPRIVNGPTLLAGLAVCASCGAGMTRTGTRRRGRDYTYYSCGGRHQKGRSVCRGRHVPMAKLDGLIVENVKEHLFSGDRLAITLGALAERQSAKDQTTEKRRTSLQAEVTSCDDRLKRLYRAIEEGVAELDADLKQRIQTLKQERQLAQAALDRLVVQARTAATITPDRLEAFSQLMRDKLDTGDARSRKAYCSQSSPGLRSTAKRYGCSAIGPSLPLPPPV